MGFLAGLFRMTVPELPIATAIVNADAQVEPGYLYRVAASDAGVTLTMTPQSLSTVAGKRFALKVFEAAPTPPGGTLAIAVPAGQQIEADDGVLADSVELVDQTLGTYREWVCDAEGNWLMVNGGWQ